MGATYRKIVTRDCYDNGLYDKMCTCLPSDIEREKLDKYAHWYDALYYLEDILEHNRDVNMLINIDSDCFVTNWEAIESLMAYMHDKCIPYAGVYDSSDYIPHRSSPHPIMNPFFCIFNMDALQFDKEYQHEDINEPFDKFWLRLADLNTGHIALGTKTLEDGITTLVCDGLDQPFAVHTWYSREYNTDEYHKERIDNIYERVNNRTI